MRKAQSAPGGRTRSKAEAFGGSIETDGAAFVKLLRVRLAKAEL